MKKFLNVLVVIVAMNTVALAETPIGYTEVEVFATIKSIVAVNQARNVQCWCVKIDGRPDYTFILTDEKGTVGERVILYIVSRQALPGAHPLIKVKHLR